MENGSWVYDNVTLRCMAVENFSKVYMDKDPVTIVTLPSGLYPKLENNDQLSS